MRPTMMYRVYAAVTRIALPFLARGEKRKVTEQGFSAARADEKLGMATQDRPKGPVIWFHAASVGESVSVLTLLHELAAHLPQTHFLITSGTPTSAQVVNARLPARTIHQFAPLDAPGPVSQFLTHWQPDAGIFVESELWPQTLWRAKQSGTRMALVNARLSEKSIAQWRKAPKTAHQILSVFCAISAQNDTTQDALLSLGAQTDQMHPGVNLKSFAPALPIDTDHVARFQNALAGRPVWVAASTHPGEEEILLDAHGKLLETHPDLVLVLVPRHPDRGPEIAAQITALGWNAPRHAQGALPDGPVFLADTLGELGTFYALTDIVFLGGSLLPIGGHNPFEPAATGAAILSGPHVTNFVETYDAMEHASAVLYANDADDIAKHINHLLTDQTAHQAACKAAKSFCADRSDALTATAKLLIDTLELSDA